MGIDVVVKQCFCNVDSNDEVFRLFVANAHYQLATVALNIWSVRSFTI